MPSIEPVNTQQVLQLGSHTEKLQQTLQQQSLTLLQQMEEDRVDSTNAKQYEIQEPESSQLIEPSNPNAHPKKSRLRIHTKKELSNRKTNNEVTAKIIERHQGTKIDIVV